MAERRTRRVGLEVGVSRRPEDDRSAGSTPGPGGEIVDPEGQAVLESEGTREDHELVRRAQGGEEAAFASLVRRHEQRAWRVARNLVPSDEDAQDLAQEAFVRVFRNLASFDFQYPFTTWLYRIVTNLAIDHLRRRRPAASTASFEAEDGDWDLADANAAQPSEGLESSEVAAEVRDVMNSLAPHFQSVLVLRELEGLPCTEIAKIVGATHVTVRWRLHRGRKLFQEEWERRQRVAAARRGASDANDRERGT
ncbi:MAG: sigma-70 family RNA polymerase sigma factor [Planctomycetes bacterium]|nr:sigma-70 family RNA polymerase sigma factor [Planctomycetota bacterium]